MNYIYDDRARRRKLIKETLRDIRRRRMQARIEKAVPIVIMVLILIGVWFGLRAVDKWIDGMITEVAYAEEMPEVDNKLTIEKPKVVYATITAYTSSVDETDDTPFITASGARTKHGVLACPPKYEFGTQVVIEGRQYTCEDRMNKRYHQQERFDVWVETKSEAYQWGVQKAHIEIISEI